jgi:hypothetical protein
LDAEPEQQEEQAEAVRELVAEHSAALVIEQAAAPTQAVAAQPAAITDARISIECPHKAPFDQRMAWIAGAKWARALAEPVEPLVKALTRQVDELSSALAKQLTKDWPAPSVEETPWQIATNRHPNTHGTRWGWIDGAPGNVCWSNEPGSKLTLAQAGQMVADHNAALAKRAAAVEPAKVIDAAREALDAYENRFESVQGRYNGPIDDEMRALSQALATMAAEPERSDLKAAYTAGYTDATQAFATGMAAEPVAPAKETADVDAAFQTWALANPERYYDSNYTTRRQFEAWKAAWSCALATVAPAKGGSDAAA